MRYHKGELVMYAANGVCQIADIRDEAFSSESRTYYVLTPIDSVSQLYVPVDNEMLTGKMRPLIAREAAEQMILEAKATPLSWIEDTRARGQYFQEVFSRGDTKELLSVLYAIYERKAAVASLGKRHLMVDENALKRAEKILFGELSIVFGIPLAHMREYIR